MWKKPWGMAEGACLGLAVVLAGVLLQVALGPVVWERLAWPANVVALVVFVVAAMIVQVLKGRAYPFRFLTTTGAAVPALAYAIVLTIVMGLTRQRADGHWLSQMLTFWPFVLTYSYIALLLALLTLKRLTHLSDWRRDVPFLLNHTGLLVAMVAGTLGSGDMRRLRMRVFTEIPERLAVMDDQRVAKLPMSIELQRFIMETYDDGSPRRYASEIIVRKDGEQPLYMTTDVNHPAKAYGWKIYQYGYDTRLVTSERQMSILELVFDPWLPAVYTGIYMMLAGAVFLLFGLQTKGKER